MTLYLSDMPLWLSVFLVVVLPTLAAMAGPVLVRKWFGLEKLVVNNEVAGFKFAVVGVIYAVVLGFAVVVVWEKFRDAEAAVVQEASALVAIDRLSQGLSPEAGTSMRQHLIDYGQFVMTTDWPAMERAKFSARAGQALADLYRAVLAIDPKTPRETVIMAEMLNRVDTVTQARRTRLLLASGIVPAVLWSVLVAGAILTLSFTLFFGAHSIGAQTLMTGMLAAIIFLALFVAIQIDHPFTGSVSVGPEAMKAALDLFDDTR